MELLRELQEYDPDHGVYFRPNKLSDKRPSLEMVLSSFEFDFNVCLYDTRKKDFIWDKTGKEKLNQMPVEIYEKYKHWKVVDMSPYSNDKGCFDGFWLSLEEDKDEQLTLF